MSNVARKWKTTLRQKVTRRMVSKDQVKKYSPALADKKALVSATCTIDEIVTELSEVVERE